MKKNFKKVLGLGLISVMTVASLAGCAKKGTDGTGSTDSTTGTESTGGSEDTESGEFRIGGLGPLSGAAASYGTSVKQGAEIAIEEINAAGGVKVGDQTLKLVLDFADDEASGDTALSAYNSLMDKGAQAILGTVTSGAGLAIQEQTNADGIFQITPSGSAQALIDYPNQFRLCFTDPFQGKTMADYAIDVLGYKKVAVIFNNSDEYSTGVMQAFVDEIAAKGGEVVASEAFVTDAVDFNTQLTTIKGTDAQAIFVPAYYQDAAYITAQAADLGMNIPFLGSDGWDGVIAKVVDPKVLEGAIFLSPFYAADTAPEAQAFVKKYNEKYNTDPDQFAADGYDTVYVMKAALEKAQSTESADLIAAMPEIQVKGLTGDMTFVDRQANKDAKFVEIVNGKYTTR